ncbi:class I SAM-dependent methyltransferase [Streptomyces megasporus]|uniref:class I SAM-dependent methyltransferase n=1 Tax=Streptomyces megasporus TaxID=44060 RepID=UPI0004E0D48E|nr:methyltransferase domain-containing protein [Streptomyces megasporus]
MAPTLAQRHLPRPARDWAEIQERMLVPLYEAVYERFEVGRHTHVLGLGCGSGLALVMAAARGATVTGADTDEARLELARQRLLPEPQWGARHWTARVLSCGPDGGPDTAALREGPPPTLVTAFDTLPDPAVLARVAEVTGRDTPVVLAGWGPVERCAAAPALRVAERLAEPRRAAGRCWRPGGRDDLEDLARRAGLRPDGSGRVACPFGYADLESAVRGLLSTGLYDAAVRATDRGQVTKELAEALRPHVRPDGTVWMQNLFRYVVAMT